MKRIILILLPIFLVSGCFEDENKGKKKYYFPNKVEAPIQLEREIRLSNVEAKELEMSSESFGVFSKSNLLKTKRRYLRDKILREAFFNLADQKDKKLLRITPRDEFRFFPGEFSGGDKMLSQRYFSSDGSENMNWQIWGSLKWQGIPKNKSIDKVVLNLVSRTLEDGNLSHYGSDLLKTENGRSLKFKGTEKVSFKASFEDIPKRIFKKLTKINSNLILEILDFEFENKNMRDYLADLHKGKVRVIISSKEGEKLFFMNEGDNLSDFLKKLDPKIRYSEEGGIYRFFGHEQDLFYAYPDRNILNNSEVYGDKKIWWSNIEGDIQSYRGSKKTLVFLFATYDELRANRYHWRKKEFDLKESLIKGPLQGMIFKETTQYKVRTTHDVVPFEIGYEECLEDHRFERKGVDCYIHWKAARHYPTAIFNRQDLLPWREVALKKDDVSMGRNNVPVNGVVVLEGKTSHVNIKKTNPIAAIKGGFVGWKSYPSSLDGHKVRAPHTDLNSYPIKKGLKNRFRFEGWEKVFVPLD